MRLGIVDGVRRLEVCADGVEWVRVGRDLGMRDRVWGVEIARGGGYIVWVTKYGVLGVV
jgi:hypothetical protein